MDLFQGGTFFDLHLQGPSMDVFLLPLVLTFLIEGDLLPVRSCLSSFCCKKFKYPLYCLSFLSLFSCSRRRPPRGPFPPIKRVLCAGGASISSPLNPKILQQFLGLPSRGRRQHQDSGSGEPGPEGPLSPFSPANSRSRTHIKPLQAFLLRVNQQQTALWSI